MNLPPFNLEVIFEQFEREPDMLMLGASDGNTLSVQELFDLCGDRLDIPNIKLKYGDVRGEFRLRDAVARSYQPRRIAAEQVLITVGASEAIFIAIQVLVKAGDHVLVCDPSYQPLASIASASGASVETYHYSESNGFAPDLDSILARLGHWPRLNLLILNTPHNPTAHAFSETQMRQILKAAKDAGTQVLVDEVFHGVWIGLGQPVPSAITLDADAVVIGSLSKVYGLSGLRVGWLVGPEQFIDACRRLRHYTTIAPPLIVQDLGALAVENRAKCLMRTQTTVEKNYQYVRKWLETHRQVFDWVAPQAGLVMLLKLQHQVNTDQFARDLAKEKNVFLIPCSTTFNMPEGYLRLGLGTDQDVFVRGLQELGDFVAAKGWGHHEN